MKLIPVIFLFSCFLAIPELSYCGPGEKNLPAETSFEFSDSHWVKVLAEFEESVKGLTTDLENLQNQKKAHQEAIAGLESKINDLRQKEKEGSNLFEEIRLKGLLNDLKQKLEENSEIERQWVDVQKSFEQKALSLQELYNERIEYELNNTPPNASPALLDSRLTELASIAQKRNQVDAVLWKYKKSDVDQKIPPLTFLKKFNSRDSENLQSVLDLLMDRKKTMEVKMEKWSQEEDELVNELKLQGKMQEFLDDIQRSNEDLGLPHGNLKRNDLEGMLGKNKRATLESRLNDVRKSETQGQAMLEEIVKLIDKINGQINLLKKGR